MGRSVSYPSGSFVAFTLLEVEESDDWEFEYEWLQGDLVERAMRLFPSLTPHDGWRGREDRILARNAFADWQTARSPRARRWLAQIALRFDAEFGDYDCLGHMSNGEGVYRKRVA